MSAVRLIFLLAVATADTVSLARGAVPEQIVPVNPEPGSPVFTRPSSSTTTGGTAATSSYQGAWGTADASATLMAQTYGADAVAAARAAGINPDTLAAFGQIESHFQNVGNTSSSAQGVWQVTDGTWNQYASRLGLSTADRSDPVAQAKVASAIISDYASTVSRATGAPATGTQVYGAYMFGTKAGSAIATASNPNAPLSQFVSAKALAANNMSGWTVGQYQQTVASRMGSGASEAVTS
ncbi:transglycosylase SLT domain-containing protein [Gluconobacter cerinus]|uniref:Transglycosylase SLT domain protein n=1 Tax=Gluconobacter cerinus TaxID=38307 RepID=A0A1B6VGK5_9PROT|nr:transglycosylase SLT domain-containing protein [Gluconobacter cerinus]OAJ66351.1 Transglycosylase SLT domain protein [Gluconobacter cerinus]